MIPPALAGNHAVAECVNDGERRTAVELELPQVGVQGLLEEGAITEQRSVPHEEADLTVAGGGEVSVILPGSLRSRASGCT